MKNEMKIYTNEVVHDAVTEFIDKHLHENMEAIRDLYIMVEKLSTEAQRRILEYQRIQN